MKKLTLILALVLCLVLCAFAFASCGKKKAASTTAAGKTECVHAWGDYVVDLEPTCSDAGVKSKYCTKCGAQDPASVAEVDPLPHTEAENYTVDTPATCSAEGWESKHCTVCGQPVPSTVRKIEIDENAHDVDDWVTVEPTLLSPNGSRTGTCKLCNNPVEEELTFQPTVKECTASTGGEYKPAEFGILSVQGDKHFYATDTEPANDLLIEFSILWNPTMLNINGDVSGTEGPYCATRIMGTGASNLTYWSGTKDPKGSWCPYAGGFEGATLTQGGPAGMMKNHGDYSDYPNIGGDVAEADADDLDNGHEWGWHRIGLRVHQEVTNLATLKADTTAGATKPTYKTTVTVYFDGVEKFSVYGDYESGKEANRLYSVASNGDGTVTYTEIGDAVKAIPFVIHTTGVKNAAAAYIVTADYSVTCGTSFVQNVVRVDNPTAATYRVAEGVDLNARVFYKLAD